MDDLHAHHDKVVAAHKATVEEAAGAHEEALELERAANTLGAAEAKEEHEKALEELSKEHERKTAETEARAEASLEALHQEHTKKAEEMTHLHGKELEKATQLIRLLEEAEKDAGVALSEAKARRW